VLDGGADVFDVLDGGADVLRYPPGTPACLPPFMRGTRDSCQSCLAIECRAQFDACCAAPSCRDATRFTTTPMLMAIDDCLGEKCEADCIGMECHTQPSFCACIAVSPLPTEERCHSGMYPGALCCASFDWPKDGSCECAPREGGCLSGLKLVSACRR
jgi:hypothetical protein